MRKIKIECSAEVRELNESIETADLLTDYQWDRFTGEQLAGVLENQGCPYHAADLRNKLATVEKRVKLSGMMVYGGNCCGCDNYENEVNNQAKGTMTTKHTPGPWSISEYDDGSIVGKNEGTMGRPIICSMSAWFRGREPGKHATQDLMRANAHLIAAAPDLLEACRAARSAMYEAINKRGNLSLALYDLDTAIAKAEGREG